MQRMDGVGHAAPPGTRHDVLLGATSNYYTHGISSEVSDRVRDGWDADRDEKHVAHVPLKRRFVEVWAANWSTYRTTIEAAGWVLFTAV